MKSLLLFITTLLLSLCSFAQYGTPDSSFSTDGKVVSKNFGFATSVAVQADGKIVAAGLGSEGTESGFVLARYLPDGSIDESFGEKGKSFFEINPTLGPYLQDISILPDGRIVIVGIISPNAVLVCFLPDGTPDSSFGVNGIASLHIYGPSSFYEMVVQPDGRIVAAGITIDITDIENRVYYNMVARYLPDGSLDKSFNDSGIIVSLVSRFGNNTNLALQPDGKIVTAGIGGIESDLLSAARYNSDGSLDTSFGNRGSVLLSLYDDGNIGNNVNVSIVRIALQKDGSIILGGNYGASAAPDATMLAVRLSRNGDLDSTFGSGGKALAIFGKGQLARAYGLQITPDDRIVLGGYVTSDNFEFDYEYFALSGLTPGGKPDSSFGESGIVITEFPRISLIYALALQKDGRIVAAGATGGGQTDYGSFALARYLGTGGRQRPLLVRLKRFLHNHSIEWKGGNDNTAYYSIERSLGGSPFREVNRVQGNAGQSVHTYAIAAPLTAEAATDSYRVRATDAGGRSTLSNSVTLPRLNETAVSVYPNPARNRIMVKGLDKSRNYTASVTNAGGVFYLATSIKQQETATIEVDKLQAGTYLLTLRSEAGSETLRFVKQ